MKKTCFLIGLFLIFMLLTSLAAEQTWTGKISDSKCGASHKAMEHVAKRLMLTIVPWLVSRAEPSMSASAKPRFLTLRTSTLPDLKSMPGTPQN